MYGVFIDSRQTNHATVQHFVEEWLQKNSISADLNLISTVEEITTILEKKGNSYPTILVIGDETTFSAVVSGADLFTDSTVVGYIPVVHDSLAARLEIKDYKAACTVISQRKIIEFQALSINHNYFLFDTKLEVEPPHKQVDTTSISGEVKIQVDANLELSVATNQLVIHNRSQDSYHADSPLLIEAFSVESHTSSPTSQLGNIPHKSTAKSDKSATLQLRVPAHRLKIQAQTALTNEFGVTQRGQVLVGVHKKPLRLIVKRGFEPQMAMQKGLNS